MYSAAPNISSLPSGALRFPLTASRHNEDGSNDICGCWITADNSTTYEEMCRRLEGVKTEADILALYHAKCRSGNQCGHTALEGGGGATPRTTAKIVSPILEGRQHIAGGLLIDK